MKNSKIIIDRIIVDKIGVLVHSSVIMWDDHEKRRVKMKKFVPNSFSSVGKKIFVSQNHPEASDNNPGTQDQPLKTISAATEIMEPQDKVLISRGVYREEVPLRVNGHSYLPEFQPTLEAEEGEEVWIKGSDLFNPQWESLGDGTYKAALPSKLFAKEDYNPYRLSAAIDNQREVRPCSDNSTLPQTLGQLFCDNEAMRQVDSFEKLTPGSWLVDASGRSIIAAFNEKPELLGLELTVRQRCFKPEFEGTVFYNVIGIRVEHAAEPGPFCLCRPETIRENRETGVSVTKTFNIAGTTSRQCRLFCGEVSYLSTRSDSLKATVYDETSPASKCHVYDVVSDDHALSWKRVSANRTAPEIAIDDIFLDKERNLLINTKVEFLPGSVPASGCHIKNKGKISSTSRISLDNGETWVQTVPIGIDIIPFRIEKLPNGSFLLPCAKNTFPNGSLHQEVIIYSGCLKKDSSNVEWRLLSTLSVKPEESHGGIAEPRLARLSNSKLMLLLRSGAILASQNQSGAPSVKLFSISEDNGGTWSPPKPLTYDDGSYVYSPRSYQDLFRSHKNGRVYAVLNTCDQSTFGCDPRTSLEIMEIDPETFRAKRESVTTIECKHPEAHNLIRYSNWLMLESRETLNPIILMRAHMSEHCPIRFGYDLNSYRYAINLPTK